MSERFLKIGKRAGCATDAAAGLGWDGGPAVLQRHRDAAGYRLDPDGALKKIAG